MYNYNHQFNDAILFVDYRSRTMLQQELKSNFKSLYLICSCEFEGGWFYQILNTLMLYIFRAYEKLYLTN
jgi:hypothetical protein